MYGFLTDEEAINLLILAMKAAGLNNNLIANGTLGPEEKKAGNAYLSVKAANLYINPYAPVTAVVSFLHGCKNSHVHACTTNMKEFFAENGCPLD